MSLIEESRTLEYTVGQVLENMCFSDAVPVSERFSDESVVAVSVGFNGTVSGYLRLEVAPSAATWLTASFLGIDQESVQPQLSEDTVCELSNIICGRFISLLHPGARFAIGQPSRIPETEQTQQSSALSWHNFRAERGLLRVALHWDSNEGQTGR